MGVLTTAVRHASAATLLGLVSHFLAFYLAGAPLWTDRIAESIMARTPQQQALWLLAVMGAWAKPFAITGGLATLGFALYVLAVMSLYFRQRPVVRLIVLVTGVSVTAWLFGMVFDYQSLWGQVTFWLPSAFGLWFLGRPESYTFLNRGRRQVLSPLIMGAGTLAVGVESYARNRTLASRAAKTKPLYPLIVPAHVEREPGLVRPLVTPTETFYVMSKNTVDPQLDPGSWRLRITKDGQTLRELTYEELLSLPRQQRFVTLRCVSNNLVSDLMGTASWTGVQLRQLLDVREIGPEIVEVALIGADGHGDSVRPSYALSDEVLFAVGMNGRTLNRNHGFPLRALTPRYYGFRSIKWLSELALCRTPYTGTWQKRGFTREPQLQIASHIDKMRRTPDGLLVGGVSFAGPRGIRAVEVRADNGAWMPAELEAPLSAYTLTRWYARLPVVHASTVEARALDGEGHWQESQESPLYPEGVRGPTRRRVTG